MACRIIIPCPKAAYILRSLREAGIHLPLFYKIDIGRRLVLSFGSGVLTREDILGHQDKLSADPDFDPAFSQLHDYTHFTGLAITPDDVRFIAGRTIFSPNSRRALLVKNDVQFEIAKMVETHRGLNGETGVKAFRTLDEALDWISNAKAAS
ncbi:MAG: hypothetical protein ABSA96_16090 [Candidatus Acidiferrales bacterium]